MFSNDFEDAFSQFLETAEYDEAENYLFSMARRAFAAGWGGVVGHYICKWFDRHDKR